MSFLDSDLVLAEPFYAPSTEGALDGLLSQRDGMKARIQSVAASIDDESRGAMGYFLQSSGAKSGYHVAISVDDLLDTPGAIAALDADYWHRAMDLTDVYNCMPQARRDEWSNMIRERKTPEFTADAVIPTFEDLLSSRAKFFAERVDGIFRELSHTHVTNRSEGFSKRMILQYMLSEWGGSGDHRRVGYLHDLRCVIAKFMGRDEPDRNNSDRAVRVAAESAGHWITLDGGALRLRVYTGVRTGHLEVHPDMAWRLNAVLASIHPKAIPSQFREPPKRKVRDFALMQKPLPFEVLGLLQSLKGDGAELFLPYGEKPDKAQLKRLGEVLGAIGGVESDKGWRFDYQPQAVISEIVVSGCIPDAVSHQFYPTPEHIAAEAVSLAAAGSVKGHRWLEPSAGAGNLVALFPEGMLVDCIEVSALHAAILRARGHEPIVADFLKVPNTMRQYDRVVMNPPYSEGRWRAHVEHAASMVKPGGRLVAILPESARGKRLLPGFTESWGEIHKFPGTSISVSILTAVKA